MEKAIVKTNKRATFAPATTQTFIEILTGQENQDEKIFSKKDFKKLVRFENGAYFCTPLK